MKTVCLSIFKHSTLIVVVSGLLFTTSVFAQKRAADTAERVPVEIIRANVLYTVETDSGGINKLIGDVALKQDDSYMYCDSAYLNLRSNNLEAFGRVYIVQPGSQATSDYLRYTGNSRHAYMKGNVNLTDNKDNLWSEEVNYDMDTKVGTYHQTGTLKSGETIVTSNSGVYNMSAKDARFTGNVVITDPQYKIVSEDLGYNTETKVTTFYSPSVVTSDSSILNTSCGTYDTKNEIAWFPCRSSVLNEQQYLEADTIDYNRLTGEGHAYGKVIAIDTAQKTTLYAGRADYNQKEGTMLATIKPVLKQMSGDDSLFIRADTLLSGPIIDSVDTAALAMQDTSLAVEVGGRRAILADTAAPLPAMPDVVVSDSALQRNDTVVVDMRSNDAVGLVDTTEPALDTALITRDDLLSPLPRPDSDSVLESRESARVAADTAVVAAPPANTATPRFFIGYHNVMIYSDSLQGRCDSISYSQKDSVMKMMYDPIVWSRNSQITGDTILLYMDSGKLNKMYVPGNALVVSQSGPEKARLFDQVQGRTLTAFFEDNAIRETLVFPDAETIYYSKDEDEAYLGVNKASSERMRIFFKDQKITHILFEVDVEQEMTPLQQADLPNMKLSRFKWTPERRPRSLKELFE